ncbi:major facilitator superfamily MFS_1 [Alloactinosynnema sp. L-07]|nr:major facilitator superfamily MFS_1 [Alloactinosynnema sp. L-07]
MRALFAHRNTRVYLIGRMLSLAGGNVLWLGMGIWVKMLTGSNSAAGMTFFAYICGLLLLPIGGVIVDRVRRCRLLINTELVSAAWVCLLLLADEHRLWLIYVVMFGYGALSGLGLSTQAALLPQVTPDELLGEANAVQQIAEQGLRIVTPLIGAGLLTFVGPTPVILLDAALFLIAAISLIALRHREDKPVPSGERFWVEFTAGARFVGRTPEIFRLVLAGVVTLLAFGIFSSVTYAVVDEGLNQPPAFLGVVQTTSGIGAILGGLVAAAVMRRVGERGLMVCGLVGMTVACSPLLMSGWLPAVLIAAAMMGAGVVAVNVGESTLIQRRTPGELLGRVDAAVNMAVLIPQAAAIALGAALIIWMDFRVLLAVMSVLFILSAFLLARGGLRQQREPIPTETTVP